MSEEWRSIVGYEGAYEVSSWGRVRSLNKTVIRSDGRRRPFKGRVLRPGKASHGYYTVGLWRQNEGTSCTVHSLVARAFLGPTPIGEEILHKDGNKENCELSNLKFGTRSENVKQVFHDGDRKVSVEDIRTIRAQIQLGVKQKDIAKQFGISRHHVRLITERRIYADV